MSSLAAPTVVLSRRSGESLHSTSLPSSYSSSLQSCELASPDASEDLFYDQQEASKLRLRWLQNRCYRLVIYATALLVSCITITVLASARGWLSHLSESNPVQQTPTDPACADSTFKQAGWTFDSAAPPSQASDVISPTNLPMLRSQKLVSQPCADEWISQSRVCQMIQQGEESLQEAPVDVVWSFVEPTEHWAKWKDFYAGVAKEGLLGKNFRDHDQLRYSMRSVFQHATFLRQAIVLSGSFPSSEPGEPEAACRVLQQPTWLDVAATTAETSQLKLVSHYNLYSSEVNSTSSSQRHSMALPSFNSRAIESQLANLPNSSQAVLYLNDDFYINGPLAPSDVASDLLGPTYKLAADMWIRGESGKALQKWDGETRDRNSRSTIHLIDARFGKRERNWLRHAAYTLDSGMMREVAAIWKSALRETAETRFRGRGNEVSFTMLSTIYPIEKHREALLWSYLIAALDADGSGSYSYQERYKLRKDLRTMRRLDKLFVQEPDRTGTWNHTFYPDSLKAAGIKAPLQTILRWSSQDGYPYIGNRHTLYPRLDGSSNSYCSLSLEKCFGRRDFFDLEPEGAEPLMTPVELFKHVAFRRPSCGDCIIGAILSASGSQGLAAFLPPTELHAERRHSSLKAAREEVPFIGSLDDRWEGGDYSLDSALNGRWKPRDFAVRLIQRYSYTLGEVPFFFERLQSAAAFDASLRSIRQTKPAYIAINDMLDDTSDKEAAHIEKQLQAWHKQAFPRKMPYEKA